jgi:RNA polymerase sigma factor (sigma-70 family)
MLNVKDATLSKARKQDAELDRAFEAFVGENQRDLYRYCYMLTGCQHDAEDLAQETWLKVYTAFGHVRQAVESKAYLRKIALNRWVDLQRKRRIPSTAMEEVQDAPVLESDSLVLKSLLAKEALAELAQTLPPRQQAAVLLT